jgi:hypothetical protein
MDGGGHRSRPEEVTPEAARRICPTIRILARNAVFTNRRPAQVRATRQSTSLASGVSKVIPAGSSFTP